MTPIDKYLLDIAEQAGVRVEYADLRPGRDGEYIHDLQLIRLRPAMNARRWRTTLAHELGHVAFADVPTRFGPVHAKQERRADEWAALRLIHIDDYRHAEHVHHGHAGAMALELGVMRSIIDAYRRLLTRIDDTVYVEPRMGAGQWTHRERIA